MMSISTAPIPTPSPAPIRWTPRPSRRSRCAAGSAYGVGADAPWSARIEIQHLDSENRNRIGTLRTTDTFGRRTRFGGHVAHRFAFGATRHELTAAIEREEEDFGSRDLQFGGPGNRDLSRARTAFVGEWRAHWGERLVTDVALRHDDFNRFADATTLRANAVLNVGAGFSLLAGYGEGIAQPSFVDLFGFPGFPFAGNPNLRPERSRGFEGGAALARLGLRGGGGRLLQRSRRRDRRGFLACSPAP